MNNAPNLYIGLGSAVYALVKTDGNLHNTESLKARMLLIEQPHGELAMQSFIMREHYDTSPEEAYRFALRCFENNRKAITKDLKKHFMALLQKIVEADEHVSSKEEAFMKQFRRDLQRI